jgi:hypothetical protein
MFHRLENAWARTFRFRRQCHGGSEGIDLPIWNIKGDVGQVLTPEQRNWRLSSDEYASCVCWTRSSIATPEDELASLDPLAGMSVKPRSVKVDEQKVDAAPSPMQFLSCLQLDYSFSAIQARGRVRGIHRCGVSHPTSKSLGGPR